MTVKSAPAMARIVPPFSAYGLNCLCCGIAIVDITGMVRGRRASEIDIRVMHSSFLFPLTDFELVRVTPSDAASPPPKTLRSPVYLISKNKAGEPFFPALGHRRLLRTSTRSGLSSLPISPRPSVIIYFRHFTARFFYVFSNKHLTTYSTPILVLLLLLETSDG